MRQGGSALSSLGLEVSAGSAAAHGAGDAMHASRSGVARGEADADAPLRAVALERQVEERGVGALRRGPTAMEKWSERLFSNKTNAPGGLQNRAICPGMVHMV